MVIGWLCQALFAVGTIVFCALTAHAVLRRDPRAGFWLTLAGCVAVAFFLTVPSVRYELVGVSLLAIVAGILMAPQAAPTPRVTFDSTATRRRR